MEENKTSNDNLKASVNKEQGSANNKTTPVKKSQEPKVSSVTKESIQPPTIATEASQEVSKDSKPKSNKKNIAVIVGIISLLLIAVSVVGYFFYQNQLTKEVVDETVAESTTTSVENNSNSEKETHVCNDNEIYTSNKLGVTLKCKIGFEIKESDTAVNILLTNKDSIIVTHSLFVTDTSLYEAISERVEEYIKLDIGERYFDEDMDNVDPEVPYEIKHSLTRKEDITIGGKSAFVFDDKYPYEGAPFKLFIVPNDESYYFIKLTSVYLDEENENRNKEETSYNSLSQILSTFKFIEPVDTSSWKTYRNEKFNFSVIYPPEAVLKPRKEWYPVAVEIRYEDSNQDFTGGGPGPLGWLLIISEMLPNNSKLTLREWAESENLTTSTPNDVAESQETVNVRDLTLGGQSAISWIDKFASPITYYLIETPDNQVVHIVSNINSVHGREDNYSEMTNEVLTSLQFQ